MDKVARPIALLTIVLAGACARDATSPVDPQPDDARPASVMLALGAVEGLALQATLRDVPDRLLERIEPGRAAPLNGALGELVAALDVGDRMAARLSLTRACAELARLRATSDGPTDAPDLEAIGLALVHAEDLLIGRRPQSR